MILRVIIGKYAPFWEMVFIIGLHSFLHRPMTSAILGPALPPRCMTVSIGGFLELGRQVVLTSSVSIDIDK